MRPFANLSPTRFLNLLLLLFVLPSLQAQTTVEKRGDGWHWQVDGQPFALKGATFGYRL